jgi:hypothetical protein
MRREKIALQKEYNAEEVRSPPALDMVSKDEIYHMETVAK